MSDLLNIKAPVPKEFYVFLNLNNLHTKMNIDNTGSIFSSAFSYLGVNPEFQAKYTQGKVDYLPFVINNGKDLSTVSAFTNNITSNYRTEYNAELYRYYKCPIYPSRFSAIYAFGDYETCEKVNKKYGWDLRTVKRMLLEPTPFNRVVKVNMEIVSLERYANRVSSIFPETSDMIWRSYWSGEGNIGMELPTIDGRKELYSDVIWEYLIEGRLTLIK